ncbi:hypothetical protein MAM1_0203c07931 [Mucor ambiguus]|uniref:SH3 domain-containing protein n=1 Tax=Mucor ambiguus TaxID=91626 RepID=A0A0C9LWF2_9FUNG|nr:hypothetical protein MAM1_0203c07931 [Mucor ambiguus]
MSENDVILGSSEKKEKKEKKDKKKDKKKKDKKKIDALGDSVDSLSLKSLDDYDDERFKPVRNPAFNPALVSPLSSPAKSRNSVLSDSNGSNSDEKWTISSKSKDIPLIQTNTGANAGPNNASTTEKSPLTPAELQGYAAQKFIPTNSYAHLDPSKSENAYAAFNHLQKVIMANKNVATDANQLPRNDDIASSQQQRVRQQEQQQHPSEQKNQPQQPQQPQQQRAQAPAQPIQQQARSVAQQASPSKQSPPSKQQSQQRPTQPQQQQQSSKLKPRTDGAPVVQYVRALWNYTAQIPTELSFNANDSFAVLNQQPDGWWYAELLDPNRKKRGLVPGNYMTPK